MFSLGGQVGSNLVKLEMLYLWVYSIARKVKETIKGLLVKVVDVSPCSITTHILGMCPSAKGCIKV